MIEIQRGKATEFYEILDFLDFVFSKNSAPHDFEKMYPNLYRKTDESMQNQIVLREDGVIKGCILSYPRILSVGGTELKINGIGNVACHPRERGRGFMSQLMEYNNTAMREDGVQLSNLGGKRLRYNHFGYDCGGNVYDVCLPYASVMTSFPDIDKNKYTFSELKAEDVSLVNSVKEIYDVKSCHCVYSDYNDFFLRFIIPQSGDVSYAVFCGEKLIGHISVSGGSSLYIREICLNDDYLMPDVLFCYSALTGKSLDLSFGEWQLKYLKPLFEISDDIEFGCCGKWQIIDMKATAQALLSFKSTYCDLEEGTLILDFGGEKLAFENRGGFTVSPTGAPADAFIKPLYAPGILTGTYKDAFLRQNELSKNALRLFNSWFPLPLTSFSTERV